MFTNANDIHIYILIFFRYMYAWMDVFRMSILHVIT
jgi:hypothetical protein